MTPMYPNPKPENIMSSVIPCLPLYSEVKLFSNSATSYIVGAHDRANNRTFIHNLVDTSLFKVDKKSKRKAPSSELMEFRKAMKRMEYENSEDFKGKRTFAIGEVIEPPALVLPTKGFWVHNHQLKSTGVIFAGTASTI